MYYSWYCYRKYFQIYLKTVMIQIHFVLLIQLKYFYIWKKKLLLTCCITQANILFIILSCNDYFLKYFFKKNYIEILFFLFFNIDFLYYYIKITHKHQKILIWITEKNKRKSLFFKIIFERQRKTCFNKKIQSTLKWKKILSLNFV